GVRRDPAAEAGGGNGRIFADRGAACAQGAGPCCGSGADSGGSARARGDGEAGAGQVRGASGAPEVGSKGVASGDQTGSVGKERMGRRRISFVLFGLGCLLLGAAAWAVWQDKPRLMEALEAARRASAWVVVACVALPVLNWVTTSGIFWVLTNRYGRVR